MTKILVTGGTGTVGRNVARALLASDPSCRVRVAVRDRAKAAAMLPGAELVDFAFEDARSIEAAVEGVDAVFLLTPFVDTSVADSARVVEAAKRAGVRKVVKLSAAGAETEAFELARWHRRAERDLEDSGLAWVVLRPTFFMTNFVLFYPPDAEGVIYLPTGKGRAAWIDPRDVADVAAAVLRTSEWNGKAIELTGGEALSVGEVAAILSEASGRRITHVDVPASAARGAMEGMFMPAWMVQAMLDLHGVVRNGWAEKVTSSVRHVTGRAPRTFAEFAKEHASSFATRG